MSTGEKLSPIERVERCLAQIREHESTFHAWVIVDERGAREQAERLMRTSWKDAGPLWGMPVGIKDLIDVAGLTTRAGSPLTSERPAAADAPVVARLREAGAIIMGKTVTTQWASFDPPPTLNPWDPACTPGGSSSGSAAAVALGMCEAALGSQTGGSIIRPAAYCGVAGLKPTYGRVSVEGVLPLSPSLDHVGPLARDADTLMHVFAAIVDDSRGVADPLKSPPRLGVLEDFFLSSALQNVADGVRCWLDELAVVGAKLEVVPLPASFSDVITMHYRIMAAEAASIHRESFARQPDQFKPKISQLIRDGLGITDAELSAARAHQGRFAVDIDALLGDVDALVMPATVTTAPGSETTGDPKFNSPWSYAGLPAVTFCCTMADDGMPVGIQLVGRRGEDEALLAVAAWCESVLDFDMEPPWR